MTRLYLQAPEHTYYDFEDEVELNFDYVAITGNRQFKEFGDQTILDIINGDYYDDDLAETTGNGYDYETFEELKKITGFEWTQTTIRGYSQGDWQDVYYVDDPNCDYRADIENIENFYMGKVDAYLDEDDCRYLVPHDICWKGKEAICNYLGFDPTKTTVYTISGSYRMYDYEELI